MEILKYISSWKFDPITAFLTLILISLGVYLSRIVMRYIKIWGGFAVDGIMYWLSRVIIHSLAATLTFKKYCSIQLKSNTKYLRVPSTLDISLDIDQVYVPLTLSKNNGDQENYTHRDILSVGKRIRVVGDPGSGKSSLIKRIFRDECIRGLNKPSKSRLPVLLELKNLSVPTIIADKDLDEWLFIVLRHLVTGSAIYKINECFDSYVKTSGLLILLDGLDEVATLNYLTIQKAIHCLSNKLDQLGENNTIILTVRTQFHMQIRDDFSESFPNVMFLKKFNPSDVYEFLSRWPFKYDRESRITAIFNDLTDKPTLREMCSNPLILSMYVAAYQTIGEALAPETRTEFYSKVTEELLVRRRFSQIGPLVARTKLKELREQILGKLAYEHLLNPQQHLNSLSWKDGCRVISGMNRCTITEAELALKEISKETGLITEEREGESFRFIHLTFCEFLAAAEAVQDQENGWGVLIETHKKFINAEDSHLSTRLVEVIPFMCGLLPRVMRINALNDLWEVKDSRLLARAFLETKLYDHPIWAKYISSEYNRLINETEENWNSDWLNSLHIFNVVVNDAELCATHIPTSQCVIELEVFYRSLIAKQKESLSTLLISYASQDAAAALRLSDICHLDLPKNYPDIILNNCDQKPFFAIIKQRAISEPDRICLWASLLSEAALRSSVVAFWLHDLPMVDELEIFIRKISRTKHWVNKSIIRKSFFTQILTIACNSNSTLNCDLEMLSVLKDAKPPGYYKFISLFNFGLAFLVSFVFLFISALTFTALENVRIAMLNIYFINVVLFTLALRARNLKDFYGELLFGLKMDSVDALKMSLFQKAFYRFLFVIFPVQSSGGNMLLKKISELRESGSFRKS